MLDLGSGAGLDCFLAAKQVGERGRVIGLDMTDDMLALANANRDKLGATNVEFRKGEMESMPVDDESVDVIISNCVINLSPDKDAVFRESFRVLTPGGRFHVSDIVLSRELSAAEKDDLVAVGRLRVRRAAGVGLSRTPGTGGLHERPRRQPQRDTASKPWYSATISAYKPRTAAEGLVGTTPPS